MSKSEISISVVIPVFNGEKWIKRCIESVMAQQLKNVEMICIDDGSSDKSYELLQELQKKYKNIKVIKQENKGVSAARNNGIDHAKGRWIAFLDVDDIWLPNTISEEQIEIWKEKKYDIIAFKNCNANEKITRVRFKGEREERQVIGGNTSIWCVSDHMCALLYSREIINKYKISFDEKLRYGEDTIFRLMNLYLSNKIYIKNQDLYVYVENRKSAMYRLRIDAVPYYSSIITGYLEMQDKLNSFEIEEKGTVTFGTDAAWIYLLDMAIAQCENLKSLDEVMGFKEKYAFLYNEGCKNLSEDRMKELQLLQQHKNLFKCKYMLKGIIKSLLRKSLSIPGVMCIAERFKYKTDYPSKG